MNIEFLLLAGLGQLIHICAKILSLKQKAKVGNATFSVIKFVQDDWLRVVITIAGIFILSSWMKDLTTLYPQLENHQRIIFATVGYAGSDLVLRVFSKTNAVINKTIDEKTNKADGIINP